MQASIGTSLQSCKLDMSAQLLAGLQPIVIGPGRVGRALADLHHSSITVGRRDSLQQLLLGGEPGGAGAVLAPPAQQLLLVSTTNDALEQVGSLVLMSVV
jgi:hypothetical protein